MFTNSNYNPSEEISYRIERMIQRPVFIALYTFNKDMLSFYIADCLREEFQADKEFGDNYLDVVRESVEKIIERTYLEKAEAKTFAIALADKMLETVSRKQAMKILEKMQW